MAVGDRAVNPVLEEILHSNQVRDAHGVCRPLRAQMSEAEGELIIAVFEEVKPDTSLEIGFAYGISTLFACTALGRNAKPCRHIVVDPLQSSEFAGIGLININRAGYSRFVGFFETPSELVLPELLQAKTRLQAALIAGYHTFDNALVDF